MRAVLPVLFAGIVCGPVVAAEKPPSSQEPSPSPTAKPPSPAPAAAPARATLADVSWIRGHWRDDTRGTISEEIWSPPEGDSMMGMWRLIAMGQPRVFELMTLTQESGSVILRLRHFDPHLVAWTAEKEHPLSLPLLRMGPGEAAFEGRDASGFVRLTYRRVGDEGLTITLEKEGKPAQNFIFKRIGLYGR